MAFHNLFNIQINKFSIQNINRGCTELRLADHYLKFDSNRRKKNRFYFFQKLLCKCLIKMSRYESKESKMEKTQNKIWVVEFT